MEDLKADGQPWDDSLKVVKAIESHILEALKLADDHPGLHLSETINSTLENVIACREAMEDNTFDAKEDHFGEQQAEGLDNLLEGLKDGPKDERW